MPSFMGLRSRPATSGGNHHHRRHSSILLEKPQIDDTEVTRTHKSKGSLRRLSLSFANTEENTFGGLFTTDPDEISVHRPSQDGLPKPPEENPKMHSLPARIKGPVLPHDQAGPSKEGDQGRRERSIKSERFSLLKFRHASDPQLSSRYKETIEIPTEPLPTPKIITTAPTSHQLDEPVKKRPKKSVFGQGLSPFNRKSTLVKDQDQDQDRDASSRDGNETIPENNSAPDLGKRSKIRFDPFLSKDNQPVIQGPPAYGDESSSALAIPISRLSESGGSEGSSGDHKLYARTTTTISTTTTFFRLKRKKKDKGPLFPLPERFPRPSSERTSMSATGEDSRRSMSPGRRSNQAVRFEPEDGGQITPSPSPSQSLSAIVNAPLGAPGPAIARKHSTLSNHSGTSTPSLAPPRLSARGRSSTLGSLSKLSDMDEDGTPQATISSRTSTSTNGRRSFGDLLMFSHRMRQNSAPPRASTGHSPSTPGSKSNSMQINRETEPEITYPSREESDTPATYLEKLEAAVQRGSLATILCKSGDDFSKTCLRKYMRGFSYFGESIDMAIRKMLMEVELPKETQQIDRLLAGFADRYYECNPGIFMNVDEASIVAFSILLLHSDNHNKNNKRKMQKQDYVKNTQHGRVSVSGDILECFYDNICYTPFIHFEDEVAVNSHRLAAPRPKKSLIRAKSSENITRGPVDPYTLILDGKLDSLRPPLKGVMDTEDTYSANGTLKSPNPNDHHRAFLNSAVLQIISARSRPDAFATQATITNPLEAQAGLVSIKIAKVGLLWRKDAKKKKAKRPWQEWGAILTDSKLYFFKDVGWVKKLIGQYDSHVRQPGKSGPLIFKPPLTTFEPDALMAMDDAVALLDLSYKKHKNAFTFIKHGGFEEVFLANTESEMNDWIGKLNYAATFRTAGVRMRGLLGTIYEGKHLLRKDSELSTVSNETNAGESHGSTQPGMDPQMAWEIMFYRRQLISEKISNFDDKLAIAQKELEQLMRNARHLLILLPIQAKTREAIVLAAGRMSAKLKWTRVETWRTKTHRDILIKDLEAEATTAFPPPVIKSGSATPKMTPKRSSQQQLTQRSDSEINGLVLSPTLTSNVSMRRPSQTVLEQIKTVDSSPEDQLGRRSSHGRLVPSSPVNMSAPSKDDASPRHDPGPETPGLQRRSSVASSRVHRQDDESSNNVLDDKKEVDGKRAIKDGGPAAIDGAANNESDKDGTGANSPVTPETSSPKDHRASVRRSLQRTLRDGHHSQRLPNHHHRKGKDSGSGTGAGAMEDGKDSDANNAEKLKRGAGSFILHGKKASVITMSPEWQSMSSEERLRNRPPVTEEDKEVDELDRERTPHASMENRYEDTKEGETTPKQSAHSMTTLPSALPSPGQETFHSASSRKGSLTTSMTASDGGLNEEKGSQLTSIEHSTTAS